MTHRPSPLARLALAALLATGVLVGCGDDSDGPSEAIGDDTSDAAGAAPECVVDEVADVEVEAGYPATVTHALGEATVEAAPERIVALGLAEADTLVALGVTPTAVMANPFAPDGTYPWAADLGAGVEFLTFPLGTSPPLEAIVGLEPDLILAATSITVDDDYDALAAIAPTLAYQESPFTDPWEVTTRNVARLVDDAAGAEDLVAAVHAEVAAVAEADPTVTERTAAFAVGQTPASIGVLIDEADAASRLFCAMGLQRPAVLDELTESASNAGVADVSIERVDEVDSDVLVMTHADDATREALEADPLFAAVPAVEGGGYLALSVVDAMAVRTPTPLTIPYALEVLAPVLA